MRPLRHLMAAFVVFFAASLPAYSKVYIDINAPSGKRLPLAIQELVPTDDASGFEKTFGGIEEELESTLKDDLDFSGLFELIGKEAYLEEPVRDITPEKTDFRLWRTIRAELLVKGGIRIKEKTLTVEFRLFDTVRETQLFARRYVSRPEGARQIAHRFADDLMEMLTGVKGIFSTKLVFISDRSGSKDVYISDYDGKGAKRVTFNGSINLSPQWSPDGKKLIYTSYIKGKPNLYMQELRNGALTPISDNPGLNIAGRWSPDGKKIALTLSGKKSPDLFILELDTKRYTPLTDNHAIDTSLAWSPDGKRLAFTSDMGGNPNIYVINLDGTNLKRLTFAGRYNSEPAWNPAGGTIAFTRLNHRFNIWLMDEEGRVLRELTSAGDNKSPSWSPDGSHIVFSSEDEKGQSSLFIVRSDGEGLKRIDPGPGNETSPSWSPYIKEE